jgi:thiamine pyrophosphokinase
MRVIIIGGGSLDMETAIRLIREERSFVIAADRGLDYCRLLHILPEVAVGDFDSVSAGTKEMLAMFEHQGVQIVRLNPVKDDTDMEAALTIALNMGSDGIIILGGTGSRIDHVLGNMSLLKEANEKECPAAIYDAKNRIRLISNGQSLIIKKSEQYGKYVSLFPLFGACHGVSATGFYYPLDKADIGTGDGYYTLTISNEITEDEAEISVDDGYLLVIEARD